MTRKATTKQLITQLQYTEAVIGRMLRDLEEMTRRGQHAARDGYPSSSMGGDGGGTEISRPTEVTALSPPPEDRVLLWINSAIAIVEDMNKKAPLLDGYRQSVMGVGVNERERQNSIPICANPWCGEPTISDKSPRAKRGLCWSCYQRNYREYQRTGDWRNIPPGEQEAS